MNQIQLHPDGGSNWVYMLVNDKRVTVYGWDDSNGPDDVWYNLGFKHGKGEPKDWTVIKSFINQEIPFRFIPNGSFPRISIERKYFYLTKETN